MINRDEIRQLKETAASTLRGVDIASYNLDKTDTRLNIYANSIIDNPDEHNLYELLALLRFFRFLDKYEFRSVEVKKFVKFYEQLKFTGTKGLTRYKLTPVQTFQFANIYGFYKPDGKRLTRDALLFVPRKFSKTTGVAAISIYDLLFGDNNAQSYVAANSYDQAKICFDIIRDILKAHDKKLKNFKINRETVSSLRPGRRSFARCLAADADKLDGLNASTVIVDEYSQARSADLKNVLTSSMGARVNPLTVVITTASDKLDSPFVDALNAYKSILRGELENDSVFAHIFEPDIDDEESDPSTWKKVQPHLGVTVQSDFYALEYENAKLTADNMLAFRTKLLNIFVQNSAKVWFQQVEIEALFKDIDVKKIADYPDCMCAVDLSVSDDFSAVAYDMYSPVTRSFHIHVDYYFPEGSLAEHPNRELYESWVKQGYLKLLPGKVIDYKAIAGDILEKAKYLKILKVGYDPYKSREFVNILSAAAGSEYLQPVPQTYGAFTSPVESMEIAIKTEKISFSRNPITSFCFANAMIDEDRMENRKPIKRSQYEKIDGAIASLMTFYLFDNYERKI